MKLYDYQQITSSLIIIIVRFVPLVIDRVLALMKNINDNALALMFKMVNE